MEGNVCDFDRLDEDVLPPPRKRLLAGFKKQNSNDRLGGSPSTSPTTPTEVDTRFENLFSSHSCASSSSSLEELAESSKKAALAASKAAEAARAAAEEKAIVAARAIAAAKSALELVAAFSEETSGKDGHTKRNKSKKQVMVHSLYRKHVEDENSSPMLYKLSSSSDCKGLKHKKPKISPLIEKSKFPSEGILEQEPHAMCNGKAAMDIESSSHEVATLEKGERSQCLKKLISSNWRVKKEMVTQKRKARKQLVRMVETQVDLS